MFATYIFVIQYVNIYPILSIVKKAPAKIPQTLIYLLYETRIVRKLNFSFTWVYSYEQRGQAT